MLKTAIFQYCIVYSNVSVKHIFITGNTSETFWYSLWNFIDYIRGMVRVFVYVHRIVIWLSVRFVCLVIQIKTNIQNINYLLIYLTCDRKSTFFKYSCYTFAFTISFWSEGFLRMPRPSSLYSTKSFLFINLQSFLWI